MHPDAVFIIVVFSSLAIAVAVIVTFLRRYARAHSNLDAAPTAEKISRADVDS
jgi:hypothetical protein